MRDLTAEQELAAERRRGSLLLSAGAGSGKTSVLVERCARAVIEDGVAPSRILAITFTERAAGELGERLRARFAELGDRAAARELEGAQIGTVHAFCARLLRAHALAVDLDPRFAVLDEARAARLRLQAFQRALGELLERHGSEAIDLAAAYGPDRLQATIVAVHESLRSRGQRRPALPAPEAIAVVAAPTTEAAAGELSRAIAGAQRELDVPEPGARVQSALDQLDRARTVLDAAPGATPLPGSLEGLELPGANGVLAGPGCATYRQALADYLQAVADQQARRSYPLFDALLAGFADAYAELKRRQGAVDFDDLELLARDLLRDEPDVREAWAERFELVMVDEFQDTNPRQLALLAALERSNLFTVGDELQSIYGFRDADVSLFRERRVALGERGDALVLAGNFRSRPELLRVVNAVFSNQLGAAFTPLAAMRENANPFGGPGEPLVELLITDSRGWEDEGVADVAGGLPAATRWRQAEARLLAQRIADLVAQETVRPGDIAVLVRAAGDLAVYERALEERGLPTLAAGAGGYWSHQQVGDLLAYLAALANPLDELALYSTLASPLVGVSADGLALIAAAAGRASRDAWVVLRGAFAPAGEPVAEAESLAGSLPAGDRERLARFCPELESERALAPRLPIAELLVRGIARTGYEAHVLSLRGGERRLANVHKLVRMARGYESDEGRDLRGFCDHAARQLLERGRETDAPVADADTDAVRLMTVHAAKGLEFDVVAVADLGRQGRVDVPDLLVDGDRVGMRVVALDGTGSVGALAFEQLRGERLQREGEEEQRVVYVAMTRARERLLLSGAVNWARWPAPRPGAPSLSWLGPALAENLCQELTPDRPVRELHPPGASDARVLCWLNSPATLGSVLREGSLGPVDVPGGTRAAEPAVRPVPTPSSPVQEARATVHAPEAVSYSALTELERCGYRYYLERVLGLPPDERDLRAASGAGAAAGAGGSLSPRERGTLVHSLLERLDFARPVAPEGDAVAAAATELALEPAPREARAIATLVGAIGQTELGARLAAAPRIAREQAFAFTLGPGLPLLTGVVDVIGHELGGGCLIVDYKSDRVGDADLEELTERDYGIQRRVYGLAALRAGALDVDVVHWYLERPTEPVSVRFTREDSEPLQAHLTRLVSAIGAGRFPVSARPHRELCLTCPGRRALCIHGPEATLRAGGDTPPAGTGDASQMRESGST